MTTTGSHRDLADALDAPRDNLAAWRWTVRRHLVPVRDQLLCEPSDRGDAWLSARASRALRERQTLLSRLNALAAQVMVATDVDRLVGQLTRFLVDVEHHAQRLHDLDYDDVELEIGGSE